jgi:hypothetical protein
MEDGDVIEVIIWPDCILRAIFEANFADFSPEAMRSNSKQFSVQIRPGEAILLNYDG